MKLLLDIARELADEAGFDPNIISDRHLETALHRRRHQTREPTEHTYALRVQRDAEERTELLEELLVRESWFFRDTAPFTLLTEIAKTRWQRNPSLRVLSAPCAGGEEPYSIAITLAARGIPPTAVQIDAVDLSRRGLAQAARGEYGARAVHAVPPALRDAWFHAREGGHVAIVPSLRDRVSFHRANLLCLPAILTTRTYDVIFSRNAFIYLSVAARDQVIDQFEQLLAADGVLFVGHAEAALLRGRAFAAYGPLGAFAFTRSQTTARALTPSSVSATGTAAPTQAAPLRTVGSPSATPARRKPMPLLARARDLADIGAYAEAGVLLVELITHQPFLTEAQYLLGLVRAAEGHLTEARRCFERAIYLDPEHAPSLRHLALLVAAGDNDSPMAHRLHARASRRESTP